LQIASRWVPPTYLHTYVQIQCHISNGAVHTVMDIRNYLRSDMTFFGICISNYLEQLTAIN
jgi:hypothetical protein